MDAEQLQRLAAAISSLDILVLWKFFGLQFALALVAGATSAFGASYFGKRGETLAIQADFKLIREQLAQTTRIAEDVRQSVESQVHRAVRGAREAPRKA